MVERGDDVEEKGDCKADREDNIYDDYEAEPIYVISRLMLAPKQKVETW